MDHSKTFTHERKGAPVLVPAWEKASVEALGHRAIPVILDGEMLDETNYARTETFSLNDHGGSPKR